MTKSVEISAAYHRLQTAKANYKLATAILATNGTRDAQIGLTECCDLHEISRLAAECYRAAFDRYVRLCYKKWHLAACIPSLN